MGLLQHIVQNAVNILDFGIPIEASALRWAQPRRAGDQPHRGGRPREGAREGPSAAQGTMAYTYPPQGQKLLTVFSQ